MTPHNPKGSRRERELVNLLDEIGFAVMRAPASGSATERELPDVLAGNGDVFYAIEAKASGGNPIYIQEREVRDLMHFSRGFGAIPRLAAKFDVEHGDPDYGEDTSGWYMVPPKACHVTPEGNYRIKKAWIFENGQRVETAENHAKWAGQ